MTLDSKTRQVLEAISLDSSATISERLKAIELMQSSTLTTASQHTESTSCPDTTGTPTSVSEQKEQPDIAIAGDDPVSGMPSKSRDRAAMRMGRLRLP